jgi:putative exporter of polyketide antibiotics
VYADIVVRFDLNRICIAGFVLFGVALALFAYEHVTEESITVGRVLGPGAPWAPIPVWMIIAILSAVVYLAGRVVWFAKHCFARRGGERER